MMSSSPHIEVSFIVFLFLYHYIVVTARNAYFNGMPINRRNGTWLFVICNLAFLGKRRHACRASAEMIMPAVRGTTFLRCRGSYHTCNHGFDMRSDNTLLKYHHHAFTIAHHNHFMNKASKRPSAFFVYEKRMAREILSPENLIIAACGIRALLPLSGSCDAHALT